MKTIRELKTLDLSSYFFKEMINILDIETEYFMINDFKGCKDGSILFHILFLTILNVFLKNLEFIVI